MTKTLTLALAFLVAPVVAHAATSPYLEAVCSIASQMKPGDSDGDAGSDVSRLQSFLWRAGYLDEEPTGYYGAKTQDAVARFQAARGIRPTSGIFGPVTAASYRVHCGDMMSGAAPAISLPSGATMTILSPVGGTLRRGRTTEISWTGPMGDGYEIFLMGDDNIALGAITTKELSIEGGEPGSYEWRVGRIRVDNGRGRLVTKTAPRDTYRLIVRQFEDETGEYTIVWSEPFTIK
jgi:peptidoglycan hydrolase-like protein with peptidoglycan-binding domain